MFFAKPLDIVEEADLQALIGNAVEEKKRIEYKQNLPGNSSDDRKEFLADITSFANAAGGDLFYGIEEESGVPTKVCGLKDMDVDAEKLRLENMIRDGIRPRIPSMEIQPVAVTSGTVIIVRVGKSWASPHMVTFKNHAKFYSRNSAGKYQLDVDELRAAFLLSETKAERVRNFRMDRLGKIVAGETPAALSESMRLVLHLVPFGAFDPMAKFDLSLLPHDVGRLSPMGSGGWDYRFNFDGFLNYHPYGYVQVFRNGVFEAVSTRFFYTQDERICILGIGLEQDVIRALSNYFLIQKKMGVEPPVFVMLSLLGVKGVIIERRSSGPWIGSRNYAIDRDALVVPDILLEDLECRPEEIMKPAFDAVWNAAGWPRSMSYNEEGAWIG